MANKKNFDEINTSNVFTDTIEAAVSEPIQKIGRAHV